MQSQLSPEQIDTYRENGFLAIEGFLDRAEVERLREILATAGLPDDAAARPDDRRRRLDTQRMDVWRTDERVRAFCLDPRLGEMACALEGLDGVRLWHDRVEVKPAWGDPTGWHMDTPSLPFTSPGTCTFWCALIDTNLRNGCLYFVAGSHRRRIRTNGSPRLDGLRLLHPEWEFVEPVPCPVRAGALVVHNGDTAQAASMNITPRPRPAYALTWMPAGATFDDAASADPADLDDRCPLVYTR